MINSVTACGFRCRQQPPIYLMSCITDPVTQLCKTFNFRTSQVIRFEVYMSPKCPSLFMSFLGVRRGCSHSFVIQFVFFLTLLTLQVSYFNPSTHQSVTVYMIPCPIRLFPFLFCLTACRSLFGFQCQTDNFPSFCILNIWQKPLSTALWGCFWPHCQFWPFYLSWYVCSHSISFPSYMAGCSTTLIHKYLNYYWMNCSEPF